MSDIWTPNQKYKLPKQLSMGSDKFRAMVSNFLYRCFRENKSNTEIRAELKRRNWPMINDENLGMFKALFKEAEQKIPEKMAAIRTEMQIQ